MTSLPALGIRRAAPAPARRAVERGAVEALLLGAGVAAAVTELALLRVFTRTAIHIPALEQLAGPYRAASGLAKYAFYASAVLLVCNLGALAATRAAAFVAAAFLAVAAAGRAGLVDDVGLAIGVTAVVGWAAWEAAAGRPAPRRAALVLFAGGFALSALHAALQGAARFGWRAGEGRAGLLLAAEVAAVGAALLAPAAVGARPTRREIAVAAATAAVVLGGLVANGATVKILLLWNFGLAGSLPSPVYAAAAGALVLAVLGARRAWPPRATAGLVLLFVGGVGLHSTYQSGLVVCGLLLLATAPPAAPGVAADPATPPAAPGR